MISSEFNLKKNTFKKIHIRGRASTLSQKKRLKLSRSIVTHRKIDVKHTTTNVFSLCVANTLGIDFKFSNRPLLLIFTNDLPFYQLRIIYRSLQITFLPTVWIYVFRGRS